MALKDKKISFFEGEYTAKAKDRPIASVEQSLCRKEKREG